MKCRDVFDDAFSGARLRGLLGKALSASLESVIVHSPFDIRALLGEDCGESILEIVTGLGGKRPSICLYTDFRYASMLRRALKGVKVRDIKSFRPRGAKIGFDPSIAHERYLKWEKKSKGALFVDFSRAISSARAVKNVCEIQKIREAERLTCAIWEKASESFSPGMTEREMARVIKRLIAEHADGEAFETIVCVGAAAAECHHVPDDTVWSGNESVLVDMGVKLDGMCGDLTRNIFPRRVPRLYRSVYSAVLAANECAIKAVKPGVSCKALDKIARDIIKERGFGKAFGHSLGHGVGYEVHEAFTVGKRSKEVLEKGMVLTIEPGIYLEGNLGVRIEDLVLVTDTGCEVLSVTAK